MAGSAWSDQTYYDYIFFLTASNDGVVYHEKINILYGNKDLCEKDLADIEKSCEAKGWNLYRHYVDFPEKEIHLTCYTSKDHLTETMDEVLDGYVEKMKQQCMEDK